MIVNQPHLMENDDEPAAVRNYLLRKCNDRGCLAFPYTQGECVVTIEEGFERKFMAFSVVIFENDCAVPQWSFLSPTTVAANFLADFSDGRTREKPNKGRRQD